MAKEKKTYKPRKSKVIKEPELITEPVVVGVVEVVWPALDKQGIHPLSVDYPSEGLNDIARKINEIIVYVNAL